MICSQCATPLVPIPAQGGENAKVVVTDDKRPMPLRCIGCAKVFCHVCQTTKVDASAGMSAASVSTVCPACGDRLELVRGPAPAPAPSAAPPDDARRRELKHAYKDAQREPAARREMPPGLKDLFERELGPKPPPPVKSGSDGCFPFICLVVGALAGANAFGPETSGWWAVPGGLGGLVAGVLVEWVFVKVWRAIFGGPEKS